MLVVAPPAAGVDVTACISRRPAACASPFAIDSIAPVSIVKCCCSTCPGCRMLQSSLVPSSFFPSATLAAAGSATAAAAAAAAGRRLKAASLRPPGEEGLESICGLVLRGGSMALAKASRLPLSLLKAMFMATIFLLAARLAGMVPVGG